MNVKSYNKIIIVGSAGSGKSWFAKRLSEILDLPVTHLDCEFWQPGWVETPRDEWVEKQKDMINKEKWIIDGNYSDTLELRFEAAQLVIFLDINRLVCEWSAIARHGKKRSDLPQYLEEKVDKEFWEFIKWIWSFPKTGRRKIVELHEKYPDKPFLTVKRRRNVSKLLKVIEK